MRLTKKQREQVVELLRCAADNASLEVFLPLLTAIDDVDAQQPVTGAAFSAYGLAFKRQPLSVESHRECCALLEAAARVEEGTWP